jgi:SEC-C motif-containing protein
MVGLGATPGPGAMPGEGWASSGGASRPEPCPCGGGRFTECCGPVLEDPARATTAEQLMRSRYTAFVLDDSGHLMRTWHARTRPNDVTTGGVRWTGLRILDVVDGGPGDTHGVVEFEARYRADGARGVMRERSVFERRAGRWLYVEAAPES